MKKVGNWFAAQWSRILISFFVCTLIISVLWIGQTTLLPGLSTNEVAQAASSQTLHQIINNPIGLPHKVLQFSTQQLLPGPLGVRSASALLGAITLGCFFYVLKHWYSSRIAILGTLTLGTSSWFLNIGRLGTDASMYFLLFIAIACVTWIRKSHASILSLLVSAFVVTILLYVPGMIWIVIPAVLWQIIQLADRLEKHNPFLLTAISILIILALAPIGWTLFKQPDLVKTYFGIPHTLPTLDVVGKNFLNIPVQLFYQGPNNPEIWLGRLPLLNIFSTAMFAIGLYAYAKKRRLDRTWFTLFVFIFGGALVSIQGPVTTSILTPFIYLMVAAGIALLLQQWFTVFPRNPFARTIGTVLMTLVVLIASYNGLHQYFIAWPNAPETKAVFSQKIN